MSSDGGAVWTQIDSMWYNEGACVIVHPDSANVVITGGMSSNGYFGVSVSRDSGRTWTRFTLYASYADVCYAAAFAPSEPQTAYVGGRGSNSGKVFRSTDMGATWTRTATAPPYEVNGLAVSPNDAATVIAASATGIFRTTDAGSNWTEVDSVNGYYSVRYLTADDVAAAGNGGVRVSTDRGATWTDIGAGLEGNRVSRVEFAYRDGDVLIAGTRDASCWTTDIAVDVEEATNHGLADTDAQPTIARGVLMTAPQPTANGSRQVLLDAAGRKVLSLKGGANDVSRLVPGVYFVLYEGQGTKCGATGLVRKVILNR